MTNIMESCVGKILSFLVEPAITHGAYVIQYKNQVQLLEQESKRLGEKKERIEGMVDRATNIGEVIETEVSSWLEKVEEMEGNITNFLNQPEDGESFRCFPGCMCPNLMWRHKRGMEAKERKFVVSELISRGELLQTSPVTRDASFQSELLFDSSQYYTTLKNARYRVQTMVNMLKRSCLLLNGENKNFVKMHDVIRDLAISITEEKQIEHGGGHDWAGHQQFIVDHDIRDWPKKNDAWEHHTAISLRINDAHIHFPYCPLMQTLVLKRGECSLKIPNDFFQGMEKARVLDLENISTDLPSSVFELDHLRMLRLNNCHYLGHLSTIRNLKNHIEILSLDGSTIEKLPQEIGNLTRLRSLDLRVFFLQVIPKGVISNLIHLEELYVTQRFKNWDTTTDGGMSNASIGELKSLNQLTVLHVCISTNSYKIMVQECRHLFEKLINFAIFINIDIFLGNGSSNVLEIIDIDGTHDEFCLLMDRVENRVEKLRLCHIQGLRYLSVDWKGYICQNFHNLEVSAPKWRRQQLWEIFQIGLQQQNLSSMKRFFFPVLKDLTIYKLSVKDIWNKQMIQSSKGSNKVYFSQLKKIELTRCRNLVNVFPSNMLLRLQNLETLHVCKCLSLISLVEDLKHNIQSPTVKFKLTDVFPKLRHLSLDGLPKLMKIWPNDEDCCSNDNYVHLYLRTISIRLCDSLTHAFLASVARHLASIEELHVIKCFGMEVIVSEGKREEVIDDGIIEFCQLKTLQLEYLPNLRRFYQSKSEASHLFNHQVIFPKIENVCLNNLKSSREIQLWNLLTTTQEYLHIVNISIFGCQVLTKVSSHHQKRSSRTIVDKLFLKNCQGFKHVIDLNGTISIGEEQFVDVKSLQLRDLPELVLLWNKNLHEIGSLRNLKDIIIKNCSQLKSLFTHWMATTHHLEELSVTSCEMMEEIIIIEENNINFAREEKATHHIEFPKLHRLFLGDLPNFKNFCNNERGSFSFSSLHQIVVEKCPKMKTFASGQICLPPGIIEAWVGYEEVEIIDLNTFFESRNEDNNHMTKITIWGDEGEYDSDVDISSEDD